MPTKSLRRRLQRMLDPGDRPLGRMFAGGIIILVLVSVAVCMCEGSSLHREHRPLLRGIDTVILIIFTAEYLLRLAVSEHPARKAREFIMIIVLLAILPFYVRLAAPEIAYDLTFLRLLRTFRIFRVFRLVRFSNALSSFWRVLRVNAAHLATTAFVAAVLTVVGALVLYNAEPSMFGGVPDALWWAILTVTSGTYGMNVFPATLLGRAVAVMCKVVGIGLIAVPTGIIASGMQELYLERICPSCAKGGHNSDVEHCKYCGALLLMPAKRCPGCDADDHDPDALHCVDCGETLNVQPTTPQPASQG